MDVAIFYWIDLHLQSPMLRAFMEWITEKSHFVVPGILGAVVLLVLFRVRGLIFLVVAGLAIAVDDAVLHYILKPLIARPRPCHVIDLFQAMNHCSNSYSFPSNHAGNSFTLATLASLSFRNSFLLMLTLALLVCFSRVYLGQHYITDVFGGAVCGIVIGSLGYGAYRWILRQNPLGWLIGLFKKSHDSAPALTKS